MAPPILKKRKLGDRPKARPAKKIRKQQHYSSPSSSSVDEADDFPAVNLADSDADSEPGSEAGPDIHTTEDPIPAEPLTDNASETDTDSSSTSEPTNPNDTKLTQKPKRNDPTAFASSISAILNSKLTTAKRADPVLARSSTAAEANASIADSKLEKKAKSKLREDKKEALEKGRVKDVLLGTDLPGGPGSVQEMMEEEKRLRKTAQRGVVKLFNAVRQAQVRAEEARKEAKGVTRGRREEKVGEMSKKGFLELVAGGGKGMGKAGIEEA